VYEYLREVLGDSMVESAKVTFFIDEKGHLVGQVYHDGKRVAQAQGEEFDFDKVLHKLDGLLHQKFFSDD